MHGVPVEPSRGSDPPWPKEFAATLPADPHELERVARASVDAQVGAIQVSQAYERLRNSSLWSMVIAVLFVGLFGLFFPPTQVIAWLAIVLTVQALRLWTHRLFPVQAGTQLAAPAWRRMFVIGAAAAGLAWSAGPMLLVAGPDRIETMLPVVAVVCVSAVAVAQLAVLWPSLMAFLVAALLPTAASLAWQGGPVDRVAALAVLAGLGMLLLSGRSSSRAHEALIRAELDVGRSLARTRRLAGDLARAAAAHEVEGRRLSAIVDGTAAGMVEWDVQTGQLRLNDQWARMLGRSRQELEPLDVERFLALVHPDDRAALVEASRSHAGGRLDGVDLELRLAHRSGHWVWTQLTGHIVGRDDEGRPRLVSGVYLDITERKAAERRWRTRAEMSADWFWETDERFRVTLMSDGVRHRLPIPHEDLLGRTLAEVPALRPLEAGWGELAARLVAHAPFSAFACEISAPDGQSQIVEIDGRPRFDDRGVFLGYEGVGRDVTARRRTTESLRESLALVDTLFETTPIPVVLKDVHGRYQRMNRAYHVLLEGQGAQVTSHVSEVVDQAAAALHQAVDAELFASPGTRRYEIRQRLNSGRTIDALVHKATLVDAEGKIRGLVGTLIDITEQRAAADALQSAKDAAERANRAKSAFLATMSHELRTPLTAVIGAAQLLRTAGDDRARRADLIQAIETSGVTLLGLVENVMDLSRIEAGALELERAPFDLADCVDAALATVRVQAEAKGIDLVASVDVGPSGARLGDSARLRQVLVNLLSNAVKFTLRGQVAIDVAAVGDQPERVHVAVRDTGIGIDPAAQPAIFEPFRQADEGTTRRFGGSGLGLAIVRQLVRAMGGEVTLTSEPSRGSCFEFELVLPRVMPAQEAREAESRPREPGAAANGEAHGHAGDAAEAGSPGPDGPFRVLLVEDDPTNRVIIAALLEPTGCMTETCESGARAMQALSAREFDLVLMDCQMPEIDGLEVSRRVRSGAAGPAARGVPIVALTANAFAEDRAACLGAGMDDFLTKPIRAQVLREVVRRWGTLGRQRRVRSKPLDATPQTLPAEGEAGPA